MIRMIDKKIKWDLKINIADNGSMVLLTCLKCRKKWAHVFIVESKDFWSEVTPWKKDIADKHALIHK